MIDLPSNKDHFSGRASAEPCSRSPSVPDSGEHLGRRVEESRVKTEDSDITAPGRSRSRSRSRSRKNIGV